MKNKITGYSDPSPGIMFCGPKRITDESQMKEGRQYLVILYLSRWELMECVNGKLFRDGIFSRFKQAEIVYELPEVGGE